MGPPLAGLGVPSNRVSWGAPAPRPTHRTRLTGLPGTSRSCRCGSRSRSQYGRGCPTRAHPAPAAPRRRPARWRPARAAPGTSRPAPRGRRRCPRAGGPPGPARPPREGLPGAVRHRSPSSAPPSRLRAPRGCGNRALACPRPARTRPAPAPPSGQRPGQAQTPDPALRPTPGPAGPSPKILPPPHLVPPRLSSPTLERGREGRGSSWGRGPRAGCRGFSWCVLKLRRLCRAGTRRYARRGRRLSRAPGTVWREREPARPQETGGARPLGGSEDHQLGQFNISEAESKVLILLGALASEPSSGLVGLYPSPAPRQDAHTHKQPLWAMGWSGVLGAGGCGDLGRWSGVRCFHVAEK